MNASLLLSPRLNEIFEIIANLQFQKSYSHIWDCCCDHGYLGMKVLNEELCEKLVFVDQLPHIMQQLANVLDNNNYDSEAYKLITEDAAKLKFDTELRHLAIFAGVGGERTVEIISSIAQSYPDSKIDYIFCPSTSQAALRKYLAEHDFKMAYESIVCEKKRCYEVMHVVSSDSSNELPDVSLTCDIWEQDNPIHQSYLKKVNVPRASKKPRRR